MEVTVIVLICCNIAASLLGPMVTGIGYFITHIAKGTCCGNTLEMYKTNEEVKPLKIGDDKITDLLNKSIKA